MLDFLVEDKRNWVGQVEWCRRKYKSGETSFQVSEARYYEYLFPRAVRMLLSQIEELRSHVPGVPPAKDHTVESHVDYLEWAEHEASLVRQEAYAVELITAGFLTFNHRQIIHSGIIVTISDWINEYVAATAPAQRNEILRRFGFKRGSL